MTGTNCDLFTHNQSRSYLNHLVHGTGFSHSVGKQFAAVQLRYTSHRHQHVNKSLLMIAVLSDYNPHIYIPFLQGPS